ncbi:MAG: hypothetical protein HY808_07180 [Nitrospirae bacterium]|nr:hypothetical protein [Nitrospirota bacterium]
MINIHGIGWIDARGYGCIAKGTRVAYEGDTGFGGLSKKLFSHPFKYFGRLDRISKLTCYAIALALKDAGIDYSPELKQDIGAIGANDSGSLQADIDYFNDYVNCGRTLARGNLFIYTLPSSPLGEAAIHFGLQGPVFFSSAPKKSLLKVITTASEMLLSEETTAMLAGMTGENEAVYFTLMRDNTANKDFLCDADKAGAILSRDMPQDKLVKEFSSLRKGRDQ